MALRLISLEAIQHANKFLATCSAPDEPDDKHVRRLGQRIIVDIDLIGLGNLDCGFRTDQELA